MTSPSSAVIFNRRKIQKTVEWVACSAAEWLIGERAGSLLLISVLEGAKPFTRDLTRLLKRMFPKMTVKKMEVLVQGTSGTKLLKSRKWERGILTAGAIRGQRILVVDDLVDSGKTLKALRTRLLALGAEEVKTAVLIRKFGSDSGPVDFCGIDLNLDRRAMARKGLRDYWLFGYGMDLKGKHRGLAHIGWVEIHEDEKLKNL